MDNLVSPVHLTCLLTLFRRKLTHLGLKLTTLFVTIVLLPTPEAALFTQDGTSIKFTEYGDVVTGMESKTFPDVTYFSVH